MAAGNSGVPWSATCISYSAGSSERATSTSAAGSFGERTILVGTAVSFLQVQPQIYRYSLKRSCQRHDAGGGETRDLALRQPELTQDLGCVLSEPRGPTPDRARPGPRADRAVEHPG